VQRPDAAAPTGRNIFSKIEVRSTRFLQKENNFADKVRNFFSKNEARMRKFFAKTKKTKRKKEKNKNFLKKMLILFDFFAIIRRN